MPDQIDAISALVRSHGAVVVAGAGLSHAAGFPLASHLAPLLWHALDAAPEARSRLAQRLQHPDVPAKDLVAHDPRSIAAAYDCLREVAVARDAFQRAFAARDAAATTPSPAHEALARLYHAGVVDLIATFNWDTGIERAYRGLYGRSLVPDVDLYKPHGDAAHPQFPWILPGDPGYVPPELVKRISGLVAERPRVLLIVGYSESDEVVVEALTGPLATRWIVCRIAPNASGPQDIPGRADDVLPHMAKALVAEPWRQAWEYVTFARPHDLRAALAGRGLGAGDAAVCPRLPETDRLVAQLRTTGAARLIGLPGAGKSLTAYQAAATFIAEGYEVMRLISPMHHEAAAMLDGLRFRTLALVDDAHLAFDGTLRRLEETVGPDRAVLSVWPDGESAAIRRDAIALDPKRAVRVIAAALLQDRRATLSAVQSLDDWVGDATTQESLERRIEHAAETSELPWQFCFTVGGGWRRASAAVDLARARRADTVLALAAMMQIASRDATLGRASVLRQSRAIELAEDDVITALDWLLEQRLLLGYDDLRCPHQRFASAAIAAVYEQTNDRDLILHAAREILVDSAFTVLGAYRLLHELTFSGPWGLSHNVIDSVTCERLRERCLGGASPEDRNVGGYLLSLLHVASHRRPSDLLAGDVETLIRWLEAPAYPSGFGLARLLNDFINNDRAFGAEIIDRVSPHRVADATSASRSREAAALGEMLDRLSMLASAWWKAQFLGALDRGQLQIAARTWPEGEIGGFAYLVKGLSAFDRALSLELVEAAMPQIRRAFATDPVEAYVELRDVLWYPLRVDAPLARPRPDAEGRRIGRMLFSDLTPAQVAGMLPSIPRRDLETFMHVITVYYELFPSRARSAMRRVRLNKLEPMFASHWGALPRELEILLTRLWYLGDRPAVEAWVRQHASTASILPPHIAWMMPDVAASVIERGGTVPLKHLMGFDWKTSAAILKGFAENRPDLVPQFLAAQLDDVVESLQHAQLGYNSDLDAFLMVAREYDRPFLPALVLRLDPEKARAAWTIALSGAINTRRGTALLIEAALETRGAISTVAETLRNRYPRRSLPDVS